MINKTYHKPTGIDILTTIYTMGGKPALLLRTRLLPTGESGDHLTLTHCAHRAEATPYEDGVLWKEIISTLAVLPTSHEGAVQRLQRLYEGLSPEMDIDQAARAALRQLGYALSAQDMY